jgi:K+ transporter
MFGIPGSEAMFADLGHFSYSAIQVTNFINQFSSCVLFYPTHHAVWAKS